MFYIDEAYNVKCNIELIMQVEEFAAINDNPKYGQPYLVYVFLFSSRVPFGNLSEEERDYAVTSNVSRRFGVVPKEFYKTQAFKDAAKVFRKIFKDPLYDQYIQYQKDIEHINNLKEALDLSQAENVDLFNAYIDMVKKTNALLMEIEKAVKESLNLEGETLGMEQIRQELESLSSN